MAKKKTPPFAFRAAEGFFAAIAEAPAEDRIALAKVALANVRGRVKEAAHKEKEAKAKIRAKKRKTKELAAAKKNGTKRAYTRRVQINDNDTLSQQIPEPPLAA